MFKEITIENFRGIKKLTLNDFGRINLLVGANNSGKTSVLEALFISLAPNNPILFHSTNAMRGLLDLKVANDNSFLETLQNSLESLFYKLNYNLPIVISCELDHPKQSRTIEINPCFSNTISTKKDSKTISSISTELKSYWKGLNFSFNISGLNKKNKSQLEKFSSKAILVHENKENNKLTVGFKPEEDSRYLEKLEKQNIQEFKAKYISSSTGVNDSFALTDLFDEIKIQRKKDELLNLLKYLESSIRDVDFVKESFYVDLEEFDKLARFEILGQGTKKLFSLACHLLGDNQNIADNSIIFIDEIENGLHYTFQKTLWDWLFKVAQEKNIQIFATTHSIDCVKAFVKAANNQKKEEMKDIRLFRLQKNKDDIVKAPKYDRENLATALFDLELDVR